MTHRRLLTRLLALTLLLGLSSLASAEPAYPSALGADSTVYVLHPGRMNELFAEQASGNENWALALDVIRPDGSLERRLVPGTDGDEVESNAALVFDTANETVYLLWESSFEAFSPLSRINLTGFGPDGWVQEVAVSGSPFVEKSSPHLAVTRDEVLVDGPEGQTARVHRTILHLVWIESDANGVGQAVYSPILFMNGGFQLTGQPIALTQLVSPIEQATNGAQLADGVLSVRQGKDPQTIVVLFGSEGSDRLSSLEFRVLPGELSLVADDVHDYLLAQTVPATPAALNGLAARTDEHLSEVAHHLNASFLALARTELATLIRDADPAEGMQALADTCRDRLIDLGGQADQAGVRKITGPARPHWIDVGVQGGGPPGREIRTFQVASRVVAERPVPGIMVERPVAILNSQSGDEAAIYWEDEGTLSYRETTADGGWSTTSKITLGGEVQADVAMKLLEERLDSR